MKLQHERDTLRHLQQNHPIIKPQTLFSSRFVKVSVFVRKPEIFTFRVYVSNEPTKAHAPGHYFRYDAVVSDALFQIQRCCFKWRRAATC